MHALVLFCIAYMGNTQRCVLILLLTFISPYLYIHIHYQGLLDVATCTSTSSMPSERVSFAPVGTAADGYTSAIVHSVCNNNSSSISSSIGDARYYIQLLR